MDLLIKLHINTVRKNKKQMNNSCLPELELSDILADQLGVHASGFASLIVCIQTAPFFVTRLL
jgi:hypothetical protein